MPDSYKNQQIFIQVVKQSSLTKTADIFGISKSSVSRVLAQIEHEWGASLLLRSTRSISVTDAGKEVYEHYLKVIDDASKTRKAVDTTQNEISGEIYLTSPEAFASLFLAPIIKNFSELHPEIKVNIDVSSDYELLINEGFDLAFRVGDLDDSTLKVKKLYTTKLALFTSPNYLKNIDFIASLNELSKHNCLIYTGMPLQNSWLRALGENDTSTVSGNIVSNSELFLIEIAKQGQGVLLFPELLLQSYLKTGELEQTMVDYSSPININAVYPYTDKLSKKVRLFLDFVAEELKSI